MFKPVVILSAVFAVVFANPGYLPSHSTVSTQGVDIVHPPSVKTYVAPYHGGYGYNLGYGYGHGLGYGHGSITMSIAKSIHGYPVATSYSSRIDAPTHSVPIVTDYKHYGYGYPSYGHLGYGNLGYAHGGWTY